MFVRAGSLAREFAGAYHLSAKSSRNPTLRENDAPKAYFMETAEEIKTEYIICPVCQGTGKEKFGLSCANCGGIGTGVFRGRAFFFWGLKLGSAVIKLGKIKRLGNLIINFSTFSIGFAGFAFLCLWIWQASSGLKNYEAFLFWQNKHWMILFFWFSLIADMFIIFRISEDEAFKRKIKKIKAKNKTVTALPDNWNSLKRFGDKIDVSAGYNYAAMRIVENAFLMAEKNRYKKVEVIHLFACLLNNYEVIAVFSRLGLNMAKLAEKMKKIFSTLETGSGTELSTDLKEVLIDAYVQASDSGRAGVKPIDLILPCVAHDKNLSEILYDLEIDKDKINNVAQWFFINDLLLENYRKYRRAARFKPATSMDRAYTAIATPVLNHFARDLTLASKWGRLDLCVGRDKELKNIFQALQGGRRGVILVGPDGVGKRTIIGGIAKLMVEENVPEFLKDKRLVELDIARLVSGASPAEAEERLLMIIDEVARAGNIILYIENIENIIGITAGAEESLELSEVLTSALERNSIYCLAAATDGNYAKYIEGSALGGALAKIDAGEPEGNEAIQIIESKIGIFENKHKIFFSYDAIESAVKLSSKFIHDRYLPDKAIEILEMAAVNAAKTMGEKSLVGREDVAKIISELTHIPATKVTEKESLTLLNLESEIHKRMIDQAEAVKMVAASLRRARAELREGKRPIANFLFLGPTGVGKTELAKTVAEVYFGKEKYMIRIDMSEYQNQDSINKMIGDASAVKGYLTEAVRKAPFSLILLDEFEKGHPDILNLFLQVMDDGRLTDGQGRTIDFTNSIIIATSNAGALFIQDSIGAGMNMDVLKDKLINEYLNKILRPELINRFDGVIVFKPLTMDNIAEIAKLMLNKIAKMLKAKGMDLRTENEGVRKLAALGFDPKFGARPLRRVLQEKIEDIIANKILAGELKRRDTVVINANAEVAVEKGIKL